MPTILKISFEQEMVFLQVIVHHLQQFSRSMWEGAHFHPTPSPCKATWSIRNVQRCLHSDRKGVLPALQIWVTVTALRGYLEGQKQSVYSNFVAIGTLIENNRLNKTTGVIKAYQTIMRACRGEVSCVVTTAKVSTPRRAHVL